MVRGAEEGCTTSDAHTMISQRSKLVIDENGLLELHIKMDNTKVVQVVVPRNLQTEVLRQLHDKMGHLGIDRLLNF